MRRAPASLAALVVTCGEDGRSEVSEPQPFLAAAAKAMGISLDLVALAAAIVVGAKKRGLALSAVERFESVTGQGVRGIIEGHRVAVGQTELTGTQVSDILAAKASELRQEGETVFFDC